MRDWSCARLVPDQSLRAVHVYFPDPWWKKRHKKRRVFTAELVREIERTLSARRAAQRRQRRRGVLRRDPRPIAASGRFREQELPARADPAHALDYLTHFERKYRLEGRPIYRAIIRC